MWVYPNQVITNNNWTTNTGIGILLALGENDGLYIYNTEPTNLLHLGMPQEVVNCEIRVRASWSDASGSDDSDLPSVGLYPPLVLNFYLASTPIDSIIIPTTSEWVTHTRIVDRWDSVELIVGIGGTVAVDFLRADPFGGLPTKRTLTGVGV
jgi:hypothetical protein